MANFKAYLDELEQDFLIDSTKLKHVTNHFVQELEKGLSIKGGSIPMNPTWVTNYPDGNEKGKYLVLDMGGTNLRVYSIQLTGEKGGFDVKQESHKLPEELKTATADELWDFVAGCLDSFLQSADFDLSTETDLSFIFSFPTTQRTIDEGILQRWTKGFNISNTEGKDAAESLRQAIKKKNLPLKVCVVTNDTTATMMASAYLNPDTEIGCVFGTGCNGAYFEKVEAIPKLANDNLDGESFMAINCEWGLSTTSMLKGQQAFEKMVAGLYLGELFRRIILDIHQRDPHTFLEGQSMERLNDTYCLDSSFLSAIEEDTSDGLREAYETCVSALGISPSLAELQFMKAVATLITTRAARLSATGVAAICQKRDLQQCHVGVEGSLFEKHPHFQLELSKAVGEILAPVAEPDSRKSNIEFMLSPGSGVGAAVIASTLKER
ncbi:Hexokinase [Fusarium culmorum]|uniref:Phosphotransferase n=1 Tax=Fusarium culmorum TaxID=5516 RepID=A0A2T4GXQ4_FUSCU|nr:Hexokinase [Fusarium culmorum]